MNISTVQKKVNSVAEFYERETIPGQYYKDAAKAVKNLRFYGITLQRTDYRNYSQVNPEAFDRTLKQLIESRLLDGNNANLAVSARVLDMKHWPEDMNSKLTFGENEVCELPIWLQLNE